MKNTKGTHTREIIDYFGSQVKFYMVDRGLTPQEMSESFNVSVKYIIDLMECKATHFKLELLPYIVGQIHHTSVQDYIRWLGKLPDDQVIVDKKLETFERVTKETHRDIQDLINYNR